MTRIASPHVEGPRECLAAHTSLALGGPAAEWRYANSLASVVDAVRSVNEGALLVLGGGSNLVCADAGFSGTVLALTTRGIHVSKQPPTPEHRTALLSHDSANVSLEAPAPPEALGVLREGDAVWLYVAAGEPWDPVVEASCRWGLAGIECLSGIPGKTGATPIQNVGAYGQELSECLWGVTCLHRKSLELAYFSAAECELGYRHSRFKAQSRDEYVVLEVVLRLCAGGAPNLSYAEIARQFSATQRPDLMAVRRAVIATRRAKSLVFDRTDDNTRNCGSFFVNPVVPKAHYAALQSRYPDTVPGYAVGQEHVKIPAAWLIEHAGFAKGERHGNVGLSTKHTLCLVAHDNATTDELVAFARSIRDRVRARFDIELVPEPIFVGVSW